MRGAAHIGGMSTQLRHQAGAPASIGGQFKSHEHMEDNIEIHPVPTMEGLEDWPHVQTIMHEGQEIYVSTDGEGHYQAWGDPVVAYFDQELGPDSEHWDEHQIAMQAKIAYDVEWAEYMRGHQLAFPGLKDVYTEPIAAALARAHGAGALTLPEGWAGGWALHAASEFMDKRMEGGEHGTDPINARCDYAEVGDIGIAYGYNLPVSLVGEIVVGARLGGESENEYSERVLAAADYSAVETFLRQRYAADVVYNGDGGDLSMEFFVHYGAEGPARTSVEAMGDRAENETLLLQARNDFEYGGAMQSGLADYLGYEAQAVNDASGRYLDTVWVKKDLVPA